MVFPSYAARMGDEQCRPKILLFSGIGSPACATVVLTATAASSADSVIFFNEYKIYTSSMGKLYNKYDGSGFIKDFVPGKTNTKMVKVTTLGEYEK